MTGSRPLLLPALAALLAAGLTPPIAAQAQQRQASGQISVTVVNRNSASVQNLYVTPSDSLPWGDDRLGKETLSAGARQTIRVDRTPACSYDLRVIYSDGENDVETDVNLGRQRTVTLTGDKDVSTLRLVRLAARRPVSLFMFYNRTGVEMTEMHSGSTSHLDGMTVDPGDHSVGRFRRADGCNVNLSAELKEGDAIFLEGYDLCTTPIVSFTQPEKKVSVRVRNASAYSLTSLYIRPSGFEIWGGDRLGSDTLSPRDTKRIDIASTPSCRFDIKASFGQGEDDVKTRVDLCERKILDVEGPEIVTGKGDKKKPAARQEERETLNLTVKNDSARPIREIFVSPARTKNWGDNLIDSALSGGQLAKVRVEQDGACLFDVKVVYEGGREHRRMNQDFCRSETVAVGGPFQNLIDGGGPELGFPVSVVNVGRAPAQSLHLTPANDTHWGEDRLGSNQLERRSRLDLRLPRAGG
ncbi:MAG: hypothetical protein ACRCTI_13680, partial [Beijerinckiaceae bacterium]